MDAVLVGERVFGSRHSPVRKGIETRAPRTSRRTAAAGADTAPLGRGLKRQAAEQVLVEMLQEQTQPR